MSYKILSKLYYQNKDEYNEIYLNRINNENTKKLNIKISDNLAFYCLAPEVFDLSIKIMELDTKVRILKKSLPDVAISQFTTKCLIDEILLTNDIEGVYSTRKEITLIINETKNNKKRRFKGLVNKYWMLASHKTELNTCEDIRKIYDELVLPEILEDDPSNAPDGKFFRKDGAEVTTSTQKIIHTGVYPESKIIDYMDSSLGILNDESIPVLIRIAIFHYLFGYIHPFYDGNGRTSRFISSFLLSDYFDSLIGYRLSYTIKENISAYYEAFKISNDFKNKGDLTPFIITFLDIIYKAFEKLYEALYDRYYKLDKTLKNINKIPVFNCDDMVCVCSMLVQAALFSENGISKKDMCDIAEISETTLRKRLSLIEKQGFLNVKNINRSKHYSFNVDKLNDIN